MKIQILQENFSKALNLTSRFVSNRAQLPILANVLLKAEKTRLYLLATNLEVSIATSIGAKLEEEGTITINARTITDLVSNIDKGAIELSTKGEELTISNGRFAGNLVGMNASDFPNIPQAIGEGAIQVSREKFSKALSQVLFAASHDESRPILTGVLFTIQSDGLTLVTTDGFRLSLKKVDATTTVTEALKAILPRFALAEIPRVESEESDIAISVSPSEAQVVFAMGSTILTSRIIEGEFPPFERIIPKETKLRVNLNKSEFHSAIKLALVIARDAGFLGKLSITDNSVVIATENSKSGNQETKIDAQVIGDGIDLHFNLRFIDEFLNSAAGSDIEIAANDVSSAVIFKDLSDPQYLHLIMPVKLQG